MILPVKIIDHNSQYHLPLASTATKELDDLMESLSGFKVNPEAGDVDVVDAKPAAVPSPTSTTYHVSSNDDYAKVEKRPSNKKAKCK